MPFVVDEESAMEETRLQKLFQILRFCGAAMVVASAGTFLVQQWDEVGQVTRYLALLGTTTLIPALGYLCGIRFQEDRSARVLMLALLAILPIHAGVLGGFLYSQFGPPIGNVAAVAQWVADSKVQAFALLAGGGAVLIPLMWAAFRTLLRSHAALLTVVSVGLHALVLVPNRTGAWATVALLAVFGGAIWTIARIKPQTREAWLAGASLLLPGVLLAVRQLAFYEITQVLFATIAAIGALAMFLLGRRLDDLAVERFALSPLLVSAALFASPMQASLRLSNSNTAMLIGVLIAAVMLAFGLQSARSRRFFVYGAVQVNVVVSLITLLIHGGAWAALQSIALGLGLLSYGFMSKRRVETYSGIAIAATGFIFEIVLAIEEFGWGGWAALAAFGLALVALTAVLERRARAVRGGRNEVAAPQPLDSPVPSV
ncbi:MAG: hypothetical protein JRJ24_12200 [Deltaproteobacteria bacterium]|nr:hypothetical protein [Deltaproteobacteria bacterium]